MVSETGIPLPHLRRLSRVIGGILLILFSLPLFAQETAGPAVLSSGPEAVRGIPFLGPNALAAKRGEYSFRDTRVRVYFTEEAILLPPGWETVACSGREYLSAPYDGGRVYYLQSSRGWSIFVFFQNPEAPACGFLEPFFSRLNYFLGISPVFSFPAVLEVSRV